MSDDWKVGDLAVCVDSGNCDCCGSPFFAPLGIYTVSYIMGECDGPWLTFAEVSPPNGHANIWHHSTFRKIRPDEPEACEEEFQILLKLSKQRVSA